MIPADTLLIWVDIETTGLDHTDDHLLEIGAVATGLDLVPVRQWEGLAYLPAPWMMSEPDTWPLDDVVRDMHTRNGLLEDCRHAGDLDEDDLVDWFLAQVTVLATETGTTQVMAAGSGVAGFDLPWLRSRADPLVDWPFSYRSLDLSPVRTMLALAGIDVTLDASSGPGKAHRALPDARAHLAEARLIRDLLGRMRQADDLFGRLIDAQDGPHATPPGGEA